MNDDEQNLDAWADSFSVGEDGVGVDTPETPSDPPADPPADDPQDPVDPLADDPVDPPEDPKDPPADDTPPEDPKDPPVDPPVDPPSEDPKPEEKPEEPAPTLTREDLKATLKELETEKTSYVEEVKSTAKDVLEQFYPEGIDRTLRDADGDPIKGIEDVMDKINPRTGENFTEEQAGAWLLAEQQKLNRQVEELEQSAERVAEVNINLKNDALRVVEKYTEQLASNPERAAQVKALYEKTLRKDPKTGITLEAPVDLVEFYDSFYGSDATPAPAPPETPPADPPKPPANPNDRADLPPTNGNDNLSAEEREWAEIAKEYQQQRN